MDAASGQGAPQVLPLPVGIAVSSVLAWVATEEANTAKREKAEAVAARNNLAEANDQLLTGVARSLLREPSTLWSAQRQRHTNWPPPIQ